MITNELSAHTPSPHTLYHTPFATQPSPHALQHTPFNTHPSIHTLQYITFTSNPSSYTHHSPLTPPPLLTSSPHPHLTYPSHPSPPTKVMDVPHSPMITLLIAATNWPPKTLTFYQVTLPTAIPKTYSHTYMTVYTCPCIYTYKLHGDKLHCIIPETRKKRLAILQRRYLTYLLIF